MNRNRRDFVRAGAVLGVASLVPVGSMFFPGQSARADEEGEGEEGISAPEDLMREHGVLNRILLIYEEGLRRLQGNQEISADDFHRPASLVRSFVEDYHEKLEEQFIFPVLEKHNELTAVIGVLRKQHAAGRKLTDTALRLSTADKFGQADSRRELIHVTEQFIRMYRPHEVREDTVVFPMLHHVLSIEELNELGERFEEQEHRLFGGDGFDNTVDQVAAIEKQLGIYDLAKFTPNV